MSTASNHRGVSGVAITSLVLGVLTLLMFWAPILHLLPGLLAVVLGIFGLRIARQGTAGGAGLAVAGILCAVLGMIPTALIVLALVGIGAAGGDVEYHVGGQAGAADGDDGTAGVTLTITRSDFFQNTEAYDIDQDTSNVDGMSSSSGVEQKEFQFDSLPAGRVRYTGKLEVTAPKQIKLTLELENSVPFRIGVEGIDDVAARDADGQPLDLDEPLPPGSHSIEITGAAP